MGKQQTPGGQCKADANAQSDCRNKQEQLVTGTCSAAAARPREIGGRDGPDPVRFGDWEKNGRCIDF